MPLIGDSIKLRVYFRSFDGQLVDPTDITLKIFNQQKEQIGVTINITTSNRESMGLYTYTYQIPDITDDLIIEFSGNNSGSLIVVRKSIKVTFV